MVKKRVMIEDFIEVLNRQVKELGNGAYVSVPKKYIGKTATVIIH